MIVEDHEIKILTRYDGMDQEEWDELIKKEALEAKEIKNAKITEYRVVSCPICGETWSNIDDFNGIWPCKHLRFWFCEESFIAFGDLNHGRFEKDYIRIYKKEEGITKKDVQTIEDCYAREEYLEKMTCPDVDIVYRTGFGGITCGPMTFTQFWGVKVEG